MGVTRSVSVALLTVLSCAPGALAEVAIALSVDSTALRFGAEELSASLRGQGIDSVTVVGETGDVVVRVEQDGVGRRPESFVMRRRGKRIEIVGDETGVMYGLFDVADAVTLGGGLSAVKPRRSQPFLAMRGIKWNLPLAGGYYAGAEGGRPGEWLWSRDFWEKHLRMMARNRYNVLTLWNGCSRVEWVVFFGCKNRNHPFG